MAKIEITSLDQLEGQTVIIVRTVEHADLVGIAVRRENRPNDLYVWRSRQPVDEDEAVIVGDITEAERDAIRTQRKAEREAAELTRAKRFVADMWRDVPGFAEWVCEQAIQRCR